MDEYFGRQWKLLVNRPDGDTVNLSEVRAEFTITRQAFIGGAGMLIMTIYNSDVFPWYKDNVVLYAGYGDAKEVAFIGNIKSVQLGRKDAKETFCTFTASDYDMEKDYVSTTLHAGATLKDQAHAIIPEGKRGKLSDKLSDVALPRGKVLFGDQYSYLGKSAFSIGGFAHIYNGMASVTTPKDGHGGAIIEVSPTTGLVGVPTMTYLGVRCTMLMTPSLHYDSLIHLESKYITEVPRDMLYGNMGKIGFDPDGIYRIITVIHSGDTYGEEWYSKLTCQAYNEAE